MREEETRRTNNYQDSPATMSHGHTSRSTLGQHQPGVTLRTTSLNLPPVMGPQLRGDLLGLMILHDSGIGINNNI